VTSSVGALLSRMHLVDRACEAGARMLVQTGAILGLDAIRDLNERECSNERCPGNGQITFSLKVYDYDDAIRSNIQKEGSSYLRKNPQMVSIY
jgi:hypothetical protein